ncbi:esterase family protein [Aldersonia sp. NBC_00410]|uniref:alpha/beta hydrolase n=1 Tax=Aldersonia sp. NBC_00410 TaxID=2975954 RepID=UPI0022526CDF|nr:alpha/beta hydrolase family protein [Aldersonia sp. NBC_00410]MCX5043478.1 esterase family protein [Aldersonia sp. NBC_00410]
MVRTLGTSIRSAARAIALAVAVTGTIVVSPTVAHAAPWSSITGVRHLGGQQYALSVYSAAMNHEIPLWVSRAADTSSAHPVLYLLNGVDGGADGAAWTGRTDVANFFAGKNVDVVVPLTGRASFYTDWENDDPILGRNQWATFLTRELPPLLNAQFHTTGRTGVVGVSMSAGSALDLAIHAPGVFQAVGAFSGCTRTSDPAGQAYVYSQVATFGGNATNMWGLPGDPAWAEHDPTLHADRLRGTAVYLAAGTGQPGPYESLAAPDGAGAALNRAVIGGPMEAVVRQCTQVLVDSVRAAGVPATFALSPVGTHAWPYWQDDLHAAWPTLGAAIGA